MEVERTKILEMLSEGKITVEEATRLLEALSGSAEDRDEGNPPRNREGAPPRGSEGARSRRRKRRHFDWGDEFSLSASGEYRLDVAEDTVSTFQLIGDLAKRALLSVQMMARTA